MRPVCPACNQRPRAINQHRGDKTYYRSRCEACIRKNKRLPKQEPRWETAGYKKKTVCDRCGFRSKFAAQLLVFHTDGNLNNTDIRNLRTICLNCVVEVKKTDAVWRPGDLSPDF